LALLELQICKKHPCQDYGYCAHLENTARQLEAGMNLLDAIGKDVYIIENERYADSDIKNMSVDELERLKMRVSLKIEGLTFAIKAKQIEYSKGGAGSTVEWYATRRHALIINQRMLPYINAIIKRRRSGKSLGELFIDQARRLLPRSDFETILNNAQIEREEAQ
jgi:hypothetical protein